MPCHHITLFLAERFVEVIAIALRTHPDVVRRTSMPFGTFAELSPLVAELAATQHRQRSQGHFFPTPF
jgi:predicted glycosyltransferase